MLLSLWPNLQERASGRARFVKDDRPHGGTLHRTAVLPLRLTATATGQVEAHTPVDVTVGVRIHRQGRDTDTQRDDLIVLWKMGVLPLPVLLAELEDRYEPEEAADIIAFHTDGGG